MFCIMPGRLYEIIELTYGSIFDKWGHVLRTETVQAGTVLLALSQPFMRQIPRFVTHFGSGGQANNPARVTMSCKFLVKDKVLEFYSLPRYDVNSVEDYIRLVAPYIKLLENPNQCSV